MGYSKLKIPKICAHCSKPFEAKTVITRFCSRECGQKAGNAKKKNTRREVKQQELIARIPSNRPYISIAEAVLLFGISRDTIYRLVRMGKIPAINLGERLTRISRAHIETMFAPLTVVPATPEKQSGKMDYSQAECYAIGEITEKFGISPSTVSNAIRRNSIPKKQIGKFVYVPKIEIDKIFTNRK
ncbi:MAG: helix-turn-helix domain-containing protein [Prevotellaceae bacterium]|jgi:excisionase family DNA binding protein|nr:helix-turn-helix domain-containing protein [Prevotellaceae bacterium]